MKILDKIISFFKRPKKGFIEHDGIFVEADDPNMARIVAEAWKTNKTLIGQVDEKGDLVIRESE